MLGAGNSHEQAGQASLSGRLCPAVQWQDANSPWRPGDVGHVLRPQQFEPGQPLQALPDR